MNVLIFSGFLGSGKTSALLPLARHIVDTSKSDKENKVMILENEVGEVGIDDAFLRGGGFKVDNLFSGCACCTVSGELVVAASRLQKEYDPDWLILETTGVAYPKKIQENLRSAAGIDARICVLVDAARWRRLFIPMQTLLSDQIIGSDAILVNKIDLVTEDVIAKVDEDIRNFEPNAVIAHISALQPVDGSVWELVLGDRED
ncbi:MAG: cobalamin biosynthesis protein P47K [Oscillospiraceae bacterium]|nr:cobalamin biosynthesis protein P47K [Oscillospiraceae bacterium]